jgi:hypothetical protein
MNCEACDTELLEIHVEREVVIAEATAVLAVKLDQKIFPDENGRPSKPRASMLTGKVIPVFGPHDDKRCDYLKEKRARDRGLVVAKGELVVPKK